MIELLACIIFFYIGKYSRTETEKKIVDNLVDKWTSKIEPGVTDLPDNQMRHEELSKSEATKQVEQDMNKLLGGIHGTR